MAQDQTQASLLGLANRWVNQRQAKSADFSVKSLDGFVGTMEQYTNELITIVGATHPDVYSALAELATNAEAVILRRKVFINGQDRTPAR